jgi:catechol 2,3-dioxygenase-like lactoylglutathione lyase family enzyme
MAVELNHTIVAARDKRAAATWFTDMMGLPAARAFGPFMAVELAHGLSFDFASTGGSIAGQHYAFLVTENEFDEIFGRIQAQGIDYWADPMQSRPGEINHRDNGRGVYFLSSDGHFLEIITRPYGSGAS